MALIALKMSKYLIAWFIFIIVFFFLSTQLYLRSLEGVVRQNIESSSKIFFDRSFDDFSNLSLSESFTIDPLPAEGFYIPLSDSSYFAIDGNTEDWASDLSHYSYYELFENITLKTFSDNRSTFFLIESKEGNTFSNSQINNLDNRVILDLGSYNLLLTLIIQSNASLLATTTNRDNYSPSSQSVNEVEAYSVINDSGYHLELRIPNYFIGNELGFSFFDSTKDNNSHFMQGSIFPVLFSRSDSNSTFYYDTLVGYEAITTSNGWVIKSSIFNRDTDEDLNKNILIKIYRKYFQYPLQRLNFSRQLSGNIYTDFGINKDQLDLNEYSWIQNVLTDHRYFLFHQERLIGDRAFTQFGIIPYDPIANIDKYLFDRFINFLLLIAIALFAFPFFYERFLKLRIKKLSFAVSNLIGPKGEVEYYLPSEVLDDEIGELSKNLSKVFSRLRSQREYLSNIGSKLSHELRTPLAIINTTIENNTNTENLKDTDRSKILDATKRIDFIIRKMSEANRLEDFIDNSSRNTFNLYDFYFNYFNAFSEIHTNLFNLKFKQNESSNKPFYGSQDLLAQALDKITENAIDFCSDPPIQVSVIQSSHLLKLCISNQGPQIAEFDLENIFLPLFSTRKHRTSTNLGLGLYMAKSIISSHHGELRVFNHSKGVQVEVIFVLD